MNSSYRRKSWTYLAILATLFCVVGWATFSHAQALGWEGETGVFVTPLAYTASAENQKIHAVTAYHYLNAGPVIGDFHEASVEVGLGKRVELGYTHEFHTFGENTYLSPLWQNGFEIFNGKVNVVPENYNKANWVPAISAGFLARVNNRNVGNYDNKAWNASGKTNGDVYVVASKAIPVRHAGPFSTVIFNGGVRGTDAELWGMGGNAPDWKARTFGAVALAFKGPRGSTLVFGSEAAQQPHHPTGFPTLNIPTTLTYCVRFVPSPKHKLNFDFGIAQIAGNVIGHSDSGGVNGVDFVDLKARHQAGVQVSYGF